MFISTTLDISPQYTYKHQRTSLDVGPSLLLGKTGSFWFSQLCAPGKLSYELLPESPVLIACTMILTLPEHMNVPHGAES